MLGCERDETPDRPLVVLKEPVAVINDPGVVKNSGKTAHKAVGKSSGHKVQLAVSHGDILNDPALPPWVVCVDVAFVYVVYIEKQTARHSLHRGGGRHANDIERRARSVCRSHRPKERIAVAADLCRYIANVEFFEHPASFKGAPEVFLAVIQTVNDAELTVRIAEFGKSVLTRELHETHSDIRGRRHDRDLRLGLRLGTDEHT